MPIQIKSITDFRKTVCAIPWMHLAFEPSGKVIPCCLTSTYNYFVGDLNNQSIEEIWNSENMKALRRDMINGVEPDICSKCFEREKVTGESGRLYHARDFPDVLKKIPQITEPDGTCTEMKLKYWDFRFSNLCNFKCRSCGPRYSSTWVPDAKKLGLISEQDKVWTIESVDEKTNFDFLKDQVQYVEKVYFAGGEPLLMPEHWQILDLLRDNQRFDVKISYNTNASVLSYGKKNAIDYWKLWDAPKVEVWTSIDEIGERAELIRAGTVWSKVEENLIALSKVDNIIVRPGITVGAWNVFRLPEIIMHFMEIGVLQNKPQHGYHYNNFFINLLEQPIHYHVSILPDEFREQTIKKLTDFIANFNSKYNTKIDELFSHILHELEKPFNQFAAKSFIEITRQIDGLRNEDTFATIPEMAAVKYALLNDDSLKKTINITPVPAESLTDLPDDPKIHFYIGKIKEIHRNNAPTILTWEINNNCNNHCSYCPSDLHDKAAPPYNWAHIKKFIKKCADQYKQLYYILTGGEPTNSPFFKDIVYEICNSNGVVELVTNLEKPLEYWKDLEGKIAVVTASYHPEHVSTADQETAFIEKIDYISSFSSVTVNVMMLPERWDQCYNFYKKLTTIGVKCKTKLTRLVPNHRADTNFFSVQYTKEQENILSSTTSIYDNRQLTPDQSKQLLADPNIVLFNGNEVAPDYTEITVFENNPLCNFRNWECDAGLESLFVNGDGDIQRSICGEGGVIGNITNVEAVNWPSESITCTKSRCRYISDIMLSKRLHDDE